MTRRKLRLHESWNLTDWLPGHTLLSWELSPDRTQLTLDTTDGEFLLETLGGCCSTSWIEDLDLVSGQIAAAEEIDLGSIELGSRHEDVQDRLQDTQVAYAVVFKMRDGQEGRLEFRNSSNGYFGGQIRVAEVPA